MAEIEATKAQNEFISPDQATRNAGAAWTAGLGLVRNGTTDPFLVAVNTVDGGRIAGIIPKGFEVLATGLQASLDQFGRYDVLYEDSTTTVMLSRLACNASGKFRLAVLGDYVVAVALEVVSGTGQEGHIYLIPYGSQVPFDAESAGGTELVAANRTLLAADHKKTFITTAVDIVFSLPATVLGLQFTVAAGIASVTTGLSLSPVAADKINAEADDADWINTPATDVVGDSQTVTGNGTTGWITTGGIGIWAA